MTKRWTGVALAIVAVMTAASSTAATTRAGTQIANTARLTLAGDADAPVVVDSNTVTIAVDALIDTTIAAERDTAPITDPAAAQALAFTVGNAGNAVTTYDLSAVTDRSALRVVLIAADTDADGRYDPAIDRAVTAVTLAPGAGQRVFVVVDGMPRDGATITATAVAHAGPDAQLGRTTGRASASVRLLDRDTPAARLDKAQSVAAPDGGTRAVSGAVVTYTLTAHFARDCAAVELSDAVPAGTRFVPGSITLDDQPLGDGTSAGRFDGAVVRVALGDMPAGAVRQIRFKAIIL